jgi:hypothetical protein
MKRISIEEATEKHNKLRQILEKYGNPEFGDCIVDEICELFNHLTTIDTETEED